VAAASAKLEGRKYLHAQILASFLADAQTRNTKDTSGLVEIHGGPIFRIDHKNALSCATNRQTRRKIRPFGPFQIGRSANYPERGLNALILLNKKSMAWNLLVTVDHRPPGLAGRDKHERHHENWGLHPDWE
jgi:hypothetical protein